MSPSVHVAFHSHSLCQLRIVLYVENYAVVGRNKVEYIKHILG